MEARYPICWFSRTASPVWRKHLQHSLSALAGAEKIQQSQQADLRSSLPLPAASPGTAKTSSITISEIQGICSSRKNWGIMIIAAEQVVA